MSKIINITDKLSNDKPTIRIGEKNYEISDSVENMLKFEELASTGTSGMMEAMEMVLGKESFDELEIGKLSIANFKVLTTAMLAAMQGVSYEEAEKRFQRQLG